MSRQETNPTLNIVNPVKRSNRGKSRHDFTLSTWAVHPHAVLELSCTWRSSGKSFSSDKKTAVNWCARCPKTLRFFKRPFIPCRAVFTSVISAMLLSKEELYSTGSEEVNEADTAPMEGQRASQVISAHEPKTRGSHSFARPNAGSAAPRISIIFLIPPTDSADGCHSQICRSSFCESHIYLV